MASQPNINAEQAFARISSIYSKWSSEKYKESFSAIFIQNGKDEEKSTKIKTSAIHFWLFGIELIDTLMVFSAKTLIILASDTKITQLNKLQAKFKDLPALLLLKKTPASNAENFTKILAILNAESKSHCFALLTKEPQYGSLVTETEKLLFSAISYEKFDIASFFIELYMCKSPGELNFMRMSGQSVVYFARSLILELEDIIEKDVKIGHKKLSEKIEKKLESDSGKAEEDLGFKIDNLDFTYTPIIQSGGHYDLRPNAESNEKTLECGTILWNIGMKYMNYNCLIIRTFFINALEVQKSIYEQCLELFNNTIARMKPGVIIKDLCSLINEELKRINEELFEKKPTHYGFGIGLEFKEMSLIINEKNEKKLEEGMTIALIFGFNELKKSSTETFAIQIADTILISGAGVENLTSGIVKTYDEISYSFEQEEIKASTSFRDKKTIENPKNQKNEKNAKNTQITKNAKNTKIVEKTSVSSKNPTTSSSTTQVFLTRTRSGLKEDLIAPVQNENTKIIEHQKELIERKKLEYQERLENNGFEGLEESSKALKVEDLIGYKNVKELPKDLIKGEIGLDKKKFTILFPIENTHFPLHIALLKNISKYFDQPFLYLRFNFFHFSEKSKGLIFPKNHPEFYIKELCFRSTEQNKMSNIFKSVKDLQKTFKTNGFKANDENESMEKTLKNPILAKLKNVKFRPNISGRKTEGHLELYENGVKFISVKGETVEIFFSQVKQMFFQPCHKPTDSNYIIALHFHCKSQVKVMNKFFDDVQVFVEALGSAREIGKDNESDDENDEEEIEKKERMKINKEFEEFVKKIEEHAGLICDIPFKELGFMGMPTKGLVFLQPTKNYLVNLQEKPFFVLCLDEVDFVCLERVIGAIKNFDMVFVFKNIMKPVVRIGTIPIESLNGIKEWIDSIDLVFGESKINLNWQILIQQTKENPKEFVEQGGWTALAEDDKEDDGDEDEGDSSFEEGEENDDSSESDEDFDEVEDDEEFEPEEEDDEEVIDEEDEEEIEIVSEEESKKKRAPPKKRNK